MVKNILVWIGLGAWLFLWPASIEAASVYGRGAYSVCGEQAACASPSQTSASPTPDITVVPLGSLDFAVNLVDKQQIPASGYEVIVTPLNGQGTSAARAEFYVAGQLAYTTTPDSTGTFYWKWNPNTYAGSQLEIKLYDNAGNVATRSFTVTIAPTSSPGASSATETPSSTQTPSNVFEAVAQAAQQVVQQAQESIQKLVRQIPVPALQAFPYLVFIALSIDMLLLLAGMRREVAAAETLRLALVREQALSNSKTTFLRLSAHYLRTPMTLVDGSLDLIPNPPARLRDATSRLHSALEAILSQVAAQAGETTSAPTPAAPLRPVWQELWRQPSFIMPLIAILLLVGLFNYLAIGVGKAAIGGIDVLTEVALSVLALIFLYILLRERSLRRRETARRRALLEHEQTLDQARNQIVQDGTVVLAGHIAAVEQAAQTAPAGKGTDILWKGTAKFKEVLNKFRTAALLEGSHSEAPAVRADLLPLIQQAAAPIAGVAAQRHVGFVLPPASQVATPHPRWLAAVLRSLFDNAVTFSPDGGAVQVTLDTQDGRTHLAVHDQGKGIPASQLPYVFEPFGRAEDALTFTHEGMGFSLYLAKLIMAYEGGEIAIASDPRTGTTVTLTLPQAT